MLKVNVDNVWNANQQESDKIKAAGALIEKVVNSDIFKQKILSFGYESHACTGFWKWKKCTTTWEEGFTTTDKTNQQVYDIIMAGKTQDENTTPDGIIDLRINILDGGGGKVIGYTTPGSDRTNTYRWVISDYTPAELAGHFFHEYLHRCGFDHASAKDHLSVPYACGYIMEDLAKSA